MQKFSGIEFFAKFGVEIWTWNLWTLRNSLRNFEFKFVNIRNFWVVICELWEILSPNLSKFIIFGLKFMNFPKSGDEFWVFFEIFELKIGL